MKASSALSAVDGIDLSVNQGEIFGLLGPERRWEDDHESSICTTRAKPTSGHVRIAGTRCCAAAKRSPGKDIGVVPQYNTLDRALSVFENLFFHCRYFGFSAPEAKARADELLKQFMLSERGQAFPNQLSGGLQQRVQIARAIAHRPAVLFLDEPSAGLDPQSRIAMWEAVEGLRGQGITVVLTTHYMEEADELCDRVAIVDHGKILALDTPEELKTKLGSQTRFELKLRNHDGLQELASQFKQLPNVQSAEVTSEGVRVFAKTTDGVLAEVMQGAQSFGVRDISISEPSLETVFIGLTGRDLRE